MIVSGIHVVKEVRLLLTEVTDVNNFPKLKRKLKQLESMEIVAGIPLEDEDLQSIAMFNEIGVEEKNIPARPFLRYSFDLNKDHWAQMTMEGVWDVLRQDSTSPSRIQNRIGEAMQASIKKSIVDWKVPPNSAVTVKLKGFNDPLVDTGHMRDSIMFTVKKKTEEDN